MLYHFETVEEVSKLNVDLMRTDLEIALTFTQIVRQTDEPEDAFRYQHNARRAYDAVRRYTEAANLTRLEQQEITRKLASLKSALRSLGESI